VCVAVRTDATLNMPMTSATELLTIAEVARICRVHEATVRRYIAKGHLRSVRVGRVIRVRSDDLEAYIGRSARDGESEDRFRPFTEDDPLWSIVGAFETEEPWVSGDKYRGLHGSAGRS